MIFITILHYFEVFSRSRIHLLYWSNH